MCKDSCNGGIGLFEMAVFILVTGLMIMTAQPIYTVYESHKHLDTTNNNIAAVQSALDTFYLKNGRFPCPAPRNAPVDGANGLGNKFGMELATCSSAGGAVAGDGTASVAGRPIGSPTPWEVRVGTVPTRTLGLPDSVDFDGWNHLLTYAVTESYAVSATAPKDMLHGAIYVVDSNKNPATAYPGIAVYVIAGANPDNSGAYGMNGKMQEPCPASGLTSYNCNPASGAQSTPFLSTLLQPSQSARLTSNAFALRAGTCISQTTTTFQGTLGNVSFFVDDSGSMATPDITTGTGTGNPCTGARMTGRAAPGCESRMAASKAALSVVIPTIINSKAQNDPTNLVGIANFATYWTRDGQDGGGNDSGATACGGLTGINASDCLFGAPSADNPVASAIGAFPIADVTSVINTPTTASITSTDYATASTTLVNNVNAMVANGRTPLYDSMIDLANGVEGGTAGGTVAKPDALIIVSDGENNEGPSSNIDMINSIATQYPNLQLNFVFVGDPVTDNAAGVQAAVFATTPQGNKLKGTFVVVQQATGILSALEGISQPSNCPQP